MTADYLIGCLTLRYVDSNEPSLNLGDGFGPVSPAPLGLAFHALRRSHCRAHLVRARWTMGSAAPAATSSEHRRTAHQRLLFALHTLAKSGSRRCADAGADP